MQSIISAELIFVLILVSLFQGLDNRHVTLTEQVKQRPE